MALQTAPSATGLFWRALQLSWLSILASIPIAIGLIGLHVILLSLSTEAAANLLEGTLAHTYTDHVLRLANLNAAGIVANLLVWGLTGWLLLSLAELIVKTFREWREVENSTQIANHRIINHPMRRTYLTRIVWRSSCIAGFILLIVGAQPVLRQIAYLDQQMLDGQDLPISLPMFLQAILLWMLLQHAAVVLLRLYSFRTRLFGEILY